MALVGYAVALFCLLLAFPLASTLGNGPAMAVYGGVGLAAILLASRRLWRLFNEYCAARA